ncbi:MAG: hypothetical protein EAZ85_02230 [Bacteroidetes bacterium]|nr:MAG: hypothetical protein EAZ85_02230 [Bacteroidota bacterium]
MTTTFQDLLELLKSKNKTDIENALSQFQYHQEAFKNYFALDWNEDTQELMNFLIENKAWSRKAPFVKIKKISLKLKAIQKIPKMIGKLKNLEFLCLSDNQIQSIPKEIGELKKLKTLYLDSNEIQNIPKEIGKLQNLTLLVLKYNNIKEIPQEIAELPKL